MTKHPALNATAASVYIVCLVLLMDNLGRNHRPESTIVGPIAFLSLFVLSASVMGFLFLGEPVQIYLEGKQKEAVAFFMQTVGVFAAITVVFLGVLFSGVLSK